MDGAMLALAVLLALAFAITRRGSLRVRAGVSGGPGWPRA
jgi:hypothetical protein